MCCIFLQQTPGFCRLGEGDLFSPHPHLENGPVLPPPGAPLCLYGKSCGSPPGRQRADAPPTPTGSPEPSAAMAGPDGLRPPPRRRSFCAHPPAVCTGTPYCQLPHLRQNRFPAASPPPAKSRRPTALKPITRAALPLFTSSPSCSPARWPPCRSGVRSPSQSPPPPQIPFRSPQPVPPGVPAGTVRRGAPAPFASPPGR